MTRQTEQAIHTDYEINPNLNPNLAGGGVIFRAVYSRLEVRGFDSRPFRFQAI